MEFPNVVDYGAQLGQSFERASANLFNIALAKRKLEKEDEQFKIDSKIKDLQLKKVEQELSPEQLAAERAKLKAETQAKNSEYTLNLLKIEQAENKERRSMEEHTRAMGILDTMMRTGKNPLPPGVTVKAGDNVTVRGMAKSGGSSDILSLLDEQEDKTSDVESFLSQFK